MKLTYTAIKGQYLRNIGKSGSTDTVLLTDFNLHLGSRYQMVMAKMQDYMTQQPKTASTVVNQQYYHYPPDVVNIEDVVVTIGSVNYPLECITSQRQWDLLNAIQIQPSAIPQFFFPRRDDFGIWPIPQGVYTITFNYHLRDRNLSIEDYTTGTIAATNGSTTITGTNTTFASYMPGMWLSVTDTTLAGWGYWYRIAAYNTATSITLENTWQDVSITGATYKIGQVPEIPDEGHPILIDGSCADYYAGLRNDPEMASWFENKFWTGDGTNRSREEGNQSIKGGLIGMMNYYADRNKQVLVRRKPKISPIGYKVWATTIT